MPKLDPSVMPGVPRFPKKLTKRDIFTLVRTHAPLILEIGCNDGQDTQEFAVNFIKGEIHAFECDPRPIAKFKARINDPKVHLHEVALADKNGTMTLHMSGGTTAGADRADWDMSSSLLPPNAHLWQHPWCTFDRKCEVPTKRLDDWSAETILNRPVDFVWMDV
jgi:FkbM family methyltransferase